MTGAGVARAVLALLLTATTTALGVIGVTPTPARAQDDPPDAVRDDGAPRLRLEGQTTWVAPDGRYVVRVRASGDVPDGAVVTADIHEATGSRNEFAQQITGGNLGEVVGQSGSQVLPSQGVPRAEVRFATDWANYASWTLWHFTRDGRFAWTAERAEDWRQPWPGHVTTRYEAKKLGDCAPVWLTFVKR